MKEPNFFKALSRLRGGHPMKTAKLFLFIFVLVFFPIFSQASNFGSLRVSLIEGDVQIKTEDTEEWAPASINMPLGDGDRIWVPEGGRAEFQLSDGTYLRLDQQSALEILTLDQNSSQFYLDEGHLYANFRGLRDSLLQIDTPLSSVRAYERSTFRVDVPGSGPIDLSVFRGVVYAETRDGRTKVESGKTLSLGEGNYAELSPLGPADDWEKWNVERDRRLAERRPPTRYLPDELQTYARDFDDNGRWVNTADYGYVWTPGVVVSAGWAPYRVGRWVWMGGDYVWISYEPWGWVPYHYGRWAFIVSIGWCWVPPLRGAVYWGPGYVGWVYTPTYVAWVPLAPREIYYGHGYYGPHSVNITNVNITNIQVNNIVYKNVNVNNAVTVVHNETFVKGKVVNTKINENPFRTHQVSVGRPEIKPEHATRMPVVKEIPDAKRPPQAIREVRVKELKEQRPLVKEKNASVLRPEAPPKEMTVKMKEGAPGKVREVKPTSQGRPPTPAPAQKPTDKTREAKQPTLTPAPAPKQSEKTREAKQPERGVVKPQEQRPPEKSIQPPTPSRPPEKAVEKPREIQAPSTKVEPPKQSNPPERGVNQPRQSVPPTRAPEKQVPKQAPVEKRVPEQSRQLNAPEKSVRNPAEAKPPQTGTDRSKELKFSERNLQQPKPAVRGPETNKGLKPAEKGAQKPLNFQPQRRTERL